MSVENYSFCASRTNRLREERTKAAVKELEKTMQCNCDLDLWEPEVMTGHSHVCRIHKAAKRIGQKTVTADTNEANESKGNDDE